MDFYNFFSFSAKKAIYRASEICTQFNNQYLEPEHAFYSILNLRSCSAVQILHQLGINLPRLTYSLEAYLYEHAGTYKGNAVFSQRTIQLLDSAYKEVKRLHHREIGTSHLLIALAGEKGPFLRSLFEEHALDSKKIRDVFVKHLKGYSQQGEQVSTEPTVEPDVAIGGIYAAQTYFDSTAKAVLVLAETAAANFGHETIRPAHILYGMLHQGNDRIRSAFEAVGYNAGELIAVSTERFRATGGPITTPEFDAAALRVLGLAFEFMLREGDARILPGNLLGALIESADTECIEILGAEPEALAKLLAALAQPNPEPQD